MFEQILTRLAELLDKYSLPYMVIGGQAVLLYGEPRLTRDIDLTLGAGPERLDDLLSLVGEAGWKLLVDAPARFVAETMVLPCQEPATGIRLDFIFSHSPYERQAMDRVHRVPIGGRSVSFASPEDLLIHKVFAGRPRDLEDARGVLRKNPSIDRAYVEHWLAQLETAAPEPLLEVWRGLVESS